MSQTISAEQIDEANGKAYVLTPCAQPYDDERYEISCKTLAGNRIPCCPYTNVGGDGVVIAIPYSPRLGVVEITLADKATNEQRTVTARLPERQSYLSRAIRKLSKGRGTNAHSTRWTHDPSTASNTQIAQVLADKANRQLVVRGMVTVESDNCTLEADEIVITCFDADYNQLPESNLTITGNTLSTKPDHPGIRLVTISFTLRVPAAIKGIAIWTQVKDRPSLSSFTIATKGQLNTELKRAAKKYTAADMQPGYDAWLRNASKATASDLEMQRSVRFDIEPKYSLVVPLFKTPPEFFTDMIESVLKQSYTNLELILVNASSDDATLSDLIDAYVRQDDRIIHIQLPENLGISGNTAAGINAASGDFVCFLDHDDVIELDMLHQYTRGINQYPETDLLYCDEDKLLEDGTYGMPYFKPDWNPDLLCSVNYVCHMLTIRKSLLASLPSPTQEHDGAQDHHLTLLAGEKARNVYHARKVLYHWRMHKDSTAANAQSKSYTSDAGVRAVQSHLDRCGISGSVEPTSYLPTMYRIRFTLEHEPLVSIVIPNKDALELLQPCIESILDKTTYTNYEIVIVENNSTDPALFDYYDRIEANHANIRVCKAPPAETFNFSSLMNFGVSQSNGEYLLFLNNDTTVITHDWIETLLGPCLRENTGVVGGMLLYPDNTIQHAGVSFHLAGPDHIGKGLPETSPHYYHSLHLLQDLTAVTGACMLTKRELFEQLGGFDEELAVDYNDIDYCLRVQHQLGKRIVYQPDARLYHYESVSRGTHTSDDAKVKFIQERGIMMQRYPQYYALGDPFMHPVFTKAAQYHHHRR